jgi:phage terminase small subunit
MARKKVEEEKEVVKKTNAEMQDTFVNLYIQNKCPTANNKIKDMLVRSGYSPKTVTKTATTILTTDSFKQRLAIRRMELAEKYNVSAERVTEEYAKIAFLDPKDYFQYDQEDGITVSESSNVDLAPVHKIKELRSGRGKNGKNLIELEFYNKIDALKSIREMMGYDQPAKSITAIAGLTAGGGIDRESIKSAILQRITGNPPTDPSRVIS